MQEFQKIHIYIALTHEYSDNIIYLHNITEKYKVLCEFNRYSYQMACFKGSYVLFQKKYETPFEK